MTENKLKTNWDLSYLFKSDSDSAIGEKRRAAKRASYKFINKWEKRDDYLKSPKVLKQALDQYEYWLKHYGAAADERYYFILRNALDQGNHILKAKLNKATEFSKKIENDIQFFELKVAKIKPELQKNFLNYKGLSPYKHFLERLFKHAKHQLSEPEEKIMNLKSTTSHANWVRMTSGFLTKEERKVLDENGKSTVKNFSEIISLMNNKNKKVRDKAAKAFNEIVFKHADVAENEINSVFLNKKINDELRGFSRPDNARHLSDDVETEVVDTLVKVVSQNFDIAKRYYKLKANLFKVKKLKYHERNVEYGKIGKKYFFKDSVKIISKVTENLDATLHQIFKNFLDEGRVDVYPKKGKKSGAFCIYDLKTHPVYILLNYTNLLDDVLTFAHELGHGINDEFVKKSQNALNFGTPISTAEVASTFFEDFVTKELMRKANDEVRLSLMMSKLNSDISSIFRQSAFYNFEREFHKKFREKGYLSKEEIGKVFQKHMVSYMGSYVEQSTGSQNWWVYVDHFRFFFYVYSYAGGLLISKALQSEVNKNPKYIKKVKEFLSTGLSDSPKNIFTKLGVDITDKKFWEKGIKEVDALLSESEKLAKKLGKI